MDERASLIFPAPPVEPHLGLVPSLIYKGRRVRVIFNTLHFRPPTETFHEFLVDVVQWTFGEQWWKTQVGMSEPDRHVVVRWVYDFRRIGARAVARGREAEPAASVHSTPASGPAWSLLSLGYDLFCLQAKDRLPGTVVQRLRDDAYFQGARYEIAAAAIVARAGCDIEFVEPPRTSGEKACEFIATHRETSSRIAVEAKSRHRDGVLNRPGHFEPTRDADWIHKRLKEARKQRPPDTPFVLFVDVNLPLSPETPPDERPWAQDLKAAFVKLGQHPPDPFNAIVVTNFAHYYDPSESGSHRGEVGLFPSRCPQVPLDPRVITALMDSLSRYDRIPSEV